MKLTLKPVEDSDIRQIEIWLNTPHVKKWFEIPEQGVYLTDWLNEVIQRNGEYSWINYFILQSEGQPIGFALYYDCWDAQEEWYNIPAKGETYSIDYLIGDAHNTGKGYGKEMIRLLINKIKQNTTAKSIIVQPDNKNDASCGVLLANGFIFDKEKNYFIKEITEKYIDIENWKQKEHFVFFYKMDYPQYNICMDLDVTNFLTFTKKEKLSFYYSMIYAVTRIVNETENFKYRIRNGKVILHDSIHPSFTEMDSDTSDDLFKMITVDYTDSISEFVQAVEKECKNQKLYLDPKKLIGRDDLIYITCIPWISFTHLSHTISLNKDDAVPRISWGKYYKNGDKVLLPFSVQVHHALADGVHAGKYIEKLQNYLDTIQEIQE